MSLELDEAKTYRITSKTSNKSLARLSKRKDSLGAQARAELKARYAKRDSQPKISHSLKDLTDRLIAGRNIDPDLLAHVKKASPKSIAAVVNKAKKERATNTLVDKARKEERRKLAAKHAADIKAIKKKLKGIKNTPQPKQISTSTSMVPRPRPIAPETESKSVNTMVALAKALLNKKVTAPTATPTMIPYVAHVPKPTPPKPLPPKPKSKPVGKAEAAIAARMYELKNQYKDFNGPEPDEKAIFQELMGHMSPDDAEAKIAEFKKLRQKSFNDWFHSI
jgi:hypothetical protein